MERNNTRVLNALYYLARNDIQATPKKLEALLGNDMNRAELNEALCALDKQGFARADVCRLSLSGLAVAHREFSGQPARAPFILLAAA